MMSKFGKWFRKGAKDVERLKYCHNEQRIVKIGKGSCLGPKTVSFCVKNGVKETVDIGLPYAKVYLTPKEFDKLIEAARQHGWA